MTGAPDEETIDDSLDEILLEANEKPLDNPLRPPQSLTKLQLPRSGSATLLGVSGLPLPGIAPPPAAPPPPGVNDEVTQIARSSLLDEPKEESTKVEPKEAARRAAASKDEVAVALTDQASAEREKALRKSVPPAPRMPSRHADVEFEDPEDGPRSQDSQDSDSHPQDLRGLQHLEHRYDDGPPQAIETPGAIAIEDDDYEDESTANGRPLASGPATSSGPAGGPRLPPPGTPFGRSEPFRLPTPSGGLRAPGGSPPFGLPAPTPSPGFGAPIIAPSQFGGARASTPAVPIPAPSGFPAAASSQSAVFSKVQLPVGGLVAFLIAAFSGGLVVGAILWRGGAPEAPAATATQVVPHLAAPVVLQPVSPPAPAPAPAAATAPSMPEAPAPVAGAHLPTPQPEGTPAVTAAAPTRPPVTARSTRRVAAAGAPKPSRPRKPAAPVPSKVSDAKGKGWVDPFAQ